MTFNQFKNKPIIKILLNRYVLILITFIVWMVFFDENSWINHKEFNNEINKLNKEKEYYKSQIDEDKELINKLDDKEELEKFAREEYKMKKENEDIYIIEYDTLNKK
ncbi:FtsB family cell division protein [Lutibacter flavus]|uniref:Cell division protein FtsB n=1 Tax=Lutibacter flavus TaxID=691689 RepID=A0A238Z356_9FLAO|nr:septum formation initiator family protein [Lutibacter flavus]SNR77273.1 Cell division protein FtsB [Lutibacter flavus]